MEFEVYTNTLVDFICNNYQATNPHGFTFSKSLLKRYLTERSCNRNSVILSTIVLSNLVY